ncbi:MAG: sulfotransferase family protein, partial [Woeseiaceae bacterium]
MPALKGMDAPIFFVGTPRSGTSLVSRIVGSHPRIAVPFESYLYKGFLPWRPHYGDLGERRNRTRLARDMLQSMRLREWIPPVDAAAALERIEANGQYDFNGIIAGLMETWCAAQGKDRWGEKTPAHIFFADRILCGFPKAQFVHIVRDGRDVAVSWKNVPFGPKHVYASARRWADVLDAGHRLQETVSDKQYLELRYEDLLHDTEATIRRVCHFLGEEYS